MKKILVINNKYKTFGGEDSNIVDELNFLRNYFAVDYLEFDNSKKISFNDTKAFFTNSNKSSNLELNLAIESFKPDFVYIHNTWFKANLGIFDILEKNKIVTLLKLHNFRYDCTRSFVTKNHLDDSIFCPKCGLTKKQLGIFNKYYQESFIKSFFVIQYGKKYFNILKNHSLKILVMNEFHKEYLKNLGVSEEKVFISFNPMTFYEKNLTEYKENSEYVVYAGRLTNSKGVNELLTSWKESKNKDLVLKIIGTGDIEKQLIKNYIDKNIEFTGELSNQETINQIKNARAVVTATKMYEGQPRLLCEASSLGVPSIYPSFGGMNDFFPSDYKLSFEQYNYSDLKKKINLLNDNNLLKKEGEKAYGHIKEKLNKESVFNEFNMAIKNKQRED